MSDRVLLPFAGHEPFAGAGLDASPAARLIGRVRVGAGCVLRAYATLRGDGQEIEAGDRCWFGAHSTVHIVHHTGPTRIGADVTVGPRALLHAVTVGDGAVVSEGAVLLDGAELGAGAVIAPDTLVPPRKRLPGGALYAGVPAVRVRPLAPGELEAFAAEQRGLAPEDPPRTAAPRIEASAGALVCDTVHVEGRVSLGVAASVWFGTRIVAGQGSVVLGARSNVQDNSTLTMDDGGAIEIGERVTIGHNVTLEACRILDGALVGNGARLARGTLVEAGACVAASAVTAPGAVVRAGMLWAGRPARPVRPLTPEERQRFGGIPDVYADDYRPHHLAS